MTASSRAQPRLVRGTRGCAFAPIPRVAGWLALVLLLGGLAHARTAGPVVGNPLTRFYPYEEIGRVSRGVHLNFDALGRLAVVQEDEYIVLNDNLWLRLSSPALAGIGMYAATPDLDGSLVYGALGSWGRLTPEPSGQLRPQSFVPKTYPKWVLATNFAEIVCRPEGVYFAGWNGVVFRDRQTGEHQFFEVPGVSCLFVFENTIYVSSHDRGVLILDASRQTLTTADRRVFGSRAVGRFARLGPNSGLLATTYRHLLRYRGGALEDLPPPLGPQLLAGVTALQALPEGGAAVSVGGIGVYIVDTEGQVRFALTGPEYSRVTALASREPGVLWAANETGVLKILYGQPFTRFGQTLGLPISWPQVVSWRGEIVIASAGRLYSPVPTAIEGPAQFQPVRGQPGAGAWGIAVVGDALLVSNHDGVYVHQPDADFALAVPGVGGARLVPVDATTCIVIGEKEISAIQVRDGHWSECAPRIPGVGYPAIVHAGQGAAWIELGVNRVARIGLSAGRLESRVFEEFPWPTPSWVNVSVLGSTVVLSGSEGQRVFFDERRQTFTAAPELNELFRQAPYPLVRICADETGTWWGSHQQGVLWVTARAGRYTFDSTSYQAIDERVPLIRALPSGEIWVSTGQSLYRLDRHGSSPPAAAFSPVLVSIRDSRTNAEIPRPAGTPALLQPLGYDQNSVRFDFFAGSYASMRPPAYEYRLNDQPWEQVASGSSVALSDLHEGVYRLRVRLIDSRGPIGASKAFGFTVTPPWYRHWYVLASYPILLAALLFGLVRFAMRRAEARNAALEQLVAQRTGELQTTMRQLQQETRTSATLAERNRLAGEIHDSLEQGFTGLTLQLETTAAFSTCSPEVKSGLAVALNMVAFSRNEVRHAVRDMHSPILASADLETALRQILAQVAPHADYARLRIEGSPVRLGSSVEHHLLRIAQEAIANAVKHAAASHLAVTLAFRKSEVELDIRDDGRGFDPAAVLNAGIGHFGLPSFRGRANKIGGTVEITSRPGAGTRITVRVPVEKAVIL
ncbi:sensor histidine kinase [Opitutus terrae]|nr:sensor histidine kinase [Opitutus terrae]